MKNRRIRVLHLLGTAHAGGIETFVLELTRHIDQRRFDVSVCVLGADGPMVEALRQAGAAVYVLGARRSFWHKAFSYFLYLHAGRFDVLHANVGGRLPRYLARLARCRLIITHIHGATSGEEAKAWREGNRAYGRRIKRAYLQATHKGVLCSSTLARMMTACYAPLSSCISVIPNGVDIDRFQPVPRDSAPIRALRAELNLPEGDPVVGFVGRLVLQKGLRYLLAAADILQVRYPNVRFIIVGDGPLRAEVEKATRLFATGRFLLVGTRTDVPELLALFDVLVVPSEWEGCPLVILEAMAVAKPVVAFDVDGVLDAIVHDETGLLVPHHNSRAFAFAIARLLDDAALRSRMGASGRKRVEQIFDVSKMTRKFESLYELMHAGESCDREQQPTPISLQVVDGQDDRGHMAD